jgi:pectate lyase
LVIAIWMLALHANAQNVTVIKATDFGVQANSFANAAPALQKAIEACKGKENAVLLLPGGRIDIWPEGSPKRMLYISNGTENDTASKIKNIAFLLDGYDNFTLDGNNSLVVLHGKMISFAILESSNIRIRNIRFDYERPTMTELTIQSVTPSVIEAKIHPDSKYWIDSGHISFYGEGWKSNSYHTISFDPVRENMYYSSLDPLLRSKAVEIAPFVIRFEGNFSDSPYKTGEVLSARDPYRDNCGAFISRSKNVELDELRMHYMHGLGIVSQFVNNISLHKVYVVPRENSGRVIASFADCFHFSGCKGKVLIDSCFTSGSHDDPVNVHGTHLLVTKTNAPDKMTVRFMHHQTYGFEAFEAGDSIAFIQPETLLPLGIAKLKAASLISLREMELEVEGVLPDFVKAGLCIENTTWTPEVTIQNSRFERTNTRGLLITTGRKVLIQNNQFYHTGMFPILIADDASSWFESGAVKDVTIRNNVFEACGYNSGSGAINIAPENHKLVSDAFVHRNIRIIDNTFINPINAVLQARSVDGLEFNGNTIKHDNGVTADKSTALIQLLACKHVRIAQNKIDLSLKPIVLLRMMATRDLKTDWMVEEKK